MTAAFEPADGVEARWKKVYRVLKGKPVDSVLTYAELDELFPGLGRPDLQSVLRRAAKEFLDRDKRALRNVRGHGYRVIDPSEHVQVARWHQQRSMKSLQRGHDAVVNVDLNGMSPEVKALTEATARALTMQMQFNRTMDVRQQRLEEAVAETVSRQEVQDETIADLKRRLEALENDSQ